MSIFRTIATVLELLPENHPILVERREQEASQVNLFTDIFKGMDEETERVLDEIIKELEGDGIIGGFTPRDRPHFPTTPDREESFMQRRISFYNDYIRSLNNEETMGKAGAITIFTLWTIFFLGVLPYAVWRICQQGWPFI